MILIEADLRTPSSLSSPATAALQSLSLWEQNHLPKEQVCQYEVACEEQL